MDWRTTVRTRLTRLQDGPGHGVRAATLTVCLLLAFGLLLLLTAVHISSTPSFCGSCHVMTPYYESWTTSSHSQIACVECHIPPGVTAEFRKKFEALSMVARYFTRTYSTNPWAEVDDTACLRCHERRLIQGREVFHNALFDHRPHLTEMRRGMKLRCTSCHSQIVQGSHISVTTSTCVLCHFKDQTLGEGTADCRMCHEPPDQVITTGNLEFDHGDVDRFGMQCIWCHEHAGEGDGRVLRERCFTCHKNSVRLEHFKDSELLHRVHVSEHKVDCMHCHLEIDHQTEPEVVRRESDCNRCHAVGSHSAQRDLYAGIGARGVQPQPSAMYAAGVRCEGCHLEDGGGAPPGPGSGGGDHGTAMAVARADAISCMACHGPDYHAIFQAWKGAIDQRLAASQRQMRQTAAALPTTPAATAWRDTWNDAGANLGLLEHGHGIHNVGYAQAILDKIHEQMNETRSAAGLRPLDRQWPAVAPASLPCMRCHLGIEDQSGRFAGVSFSHARHLQQAGLDCLRCHKPHDQREPDEVVRFGRQGCASCHHQEQEAECLTCHRDVRGREIEIDLGSFSHAFHLDDVELGCAECHRQEASGDFAIQRDTCADCHD